MRLKHSDCSMETQKWNTPSNFKYMNCLDGVGFFPQGGGKGDLSSWQKFGQSTHLGLVPTFWPEPVSHPICLNNFTIKVIFFQKDCNTSKHLSAHFFWDSQYFWPEIKKSKIPPTRGNNLIPDNTGEIHTICKKVVYFVLNLLVNNQEFMFSESFNNMYLNLFYNPCVLFCVLL